MRDRLVPTVTRVIIVAFGREVNGQSKECGGMKVGMQRVGFWLAVAMTTMLGGCGWFDSSSPVSTAPVRPGSERAVALSAALPAGVGNRQYAAPDVPVDETRSAQIGSIVQGKGGQKAQFDAAAKETAEEERKSRVETDRVDEARRQTDATAAAASPPKTSPAPASQVETVSRSAAPTLPESPPATPPPATPPASTPQASTPPSSSPAASVPAAAAQPPVMAPSEVATPVTSAPLPVAAAPVPVAQLPTPPVTPAKPGDVNKAFQPPPGWTPPVSAAPAPAEAVAPRPAVSVAEPAPPPAPVVTPTVAPATPPDSNRAFQPPAGWTPPAGNTSVAATTVAPRIAASPPPPPQVTAVLDEVPSPKPTRPVPEPVAPPSAPKLGTVSFRPQSAMMGGPARAELDRVIERASGLRAIELRAFASDANFSDARNTALARGLSVRSYLMDRGLRARIEIGAFAADGNGPGTDRVDVLGQ